ncbi:MAG: hypothetical protein QM817_25100 [Archangium sp.]
MARRVFVLLCLASSAHAAGSKAIAVAVGDCRDADLLTGATAFNDAVSTLLKTDVIDPTLVLERLRPRPNASIEDVQRQLDGARSQFYSDQFDRTLEGVRSAINSLERLPPSDAVADQLQAAWVLEGLVYKSLDRKNEQLRAWRRVLRTAPQFQLDPNAYSPSVVSQFEQLRVEMARQKKVSLTVTTTPGATIFVDGVKAGLAPLKSVSFVPGTYRVVAVAGEVQSFGYDVTLDKAPVDVAIDLSFEGSLRSQLPLCVNGGDAEAIKLAAREGAARLLVLRVDATAWVTAMLFDVATGTRVRDGGMKLSEARQGSGYSDLATFVLTGQPARLALSNRTAEKPEPVASPPPATVTAPTPILEQKPEPPVASPAPRAISLVVAGAGVVAAGIGLGVYFAGAPDRAAFANAVDASGVVNTSVLDPASAGALERAVQDNQTISMALLIGGGVAAATGAILFFVLGPSDAPKPTVMISPAGASLGLAGSF